jgi:hypothetical protein
MADGSRPARGGLRRLLLGAIGVLYVVSVPWYRESGAEPEIWLGLPDWVAVALGCYVAVAILNSIAWLLTEVEDAPPEPEP